MEEKKSALKPDSVSSSASKMIARPYPQNLIDAIVKYSVNEYDSCSICTGNRMGLDDLVDLENISSDQINGLLEAMDELLDQERNILLSIFENGKTLQQTAAPYGLSRSRIAQIRDKALRKMRHPSRRNRIIYGAEGYQQMLKDSERRMKEAVANDSTEVLKSFSIYELSLSARSYNCLIRAGYKTVWDIRELLKRKDCIFQIRNLGENGAKEIIDTMLERGLIDIGFSAGGTVFT